MINVGIVGFGRMGQRHFAKYQKIAGAEVKAVADISRARIDRIGAGSVITYDDIDILIRCGLWDVIDICTPANTHAELACMALQAGAHVICEKPIATTVEDAHKMIAAAEQTGRMLFVAHVVRYWPQYKQLAAFIRSGEFGSLLSLSMSRFRSRPGWVRDGEWSSFLELMIHDIDFVCHAIGTPAHVESQTTIGRGGQSEIASVYGCVGGHVRFHAVKRAGPNMFRASFRAEFDRASVQYDSEAQGARLRVFQEGETYSGKYDLWYDPYEAELRDFIESIEAGQQNGNGPGAAVAALGVLDMMGKL